NAAIFNPAEAAVLGRGPQCSFRVESKTGDRARRQPICGGVRGADLTILEIHHASVLPECQPHSTAIRDYNLGLLATAQRRPREMFDESSLEQVRQALVSRKPEVA